MLTDYDVPLVIKITQVDFAAEDQASLFGFWYFASTELPQNVESYLHDLVSEQCCQVEVSGSYAQVIALLNLSQPRPQNVEELRDASMQSEMAVMLDDIEAPRGTAPGLDMSVKMTETRDECASKVRNRRDVVELEIARDWNAVLDLFGGAF